jgi:tetratricopeptide (TPR) repeat protein
MAPMADGMLSLNTLTTKDIEFDLADGAVRFFDPKGCTGADFTYWSHGQAASDIRIQPPEAPQKIIVGDAKLNGVAIRVLFNPGMRDSIVNMAAAKRAGISIGAPNVSLVGAMTDEQGNKVDLWLAPIAKFEIGGETIANTYLPIADTPFGGADMVIGGDFFLTHRVYLARSQNRLYFTFNGGQVFGNGEGELASPPPGQVQAMPPPMGASGDTPTDAAGFARRGEARLALRDYDGAITDLTRAVDLEPGDAQHYLDRAMAKIYNRQVASAMTDLEEVLKLKPDNARAHAIRGQLYLIEHDDRNARADFDLVMTLDPTQALNIANIYSTSDRFALAIPIYDQWIADHAKDQADLAEALNGACWARAVANAELDKALGQCDRAVSLNPTDVRIWDTRGLVHLRLGQYDKAIADYDKVLKAQTQQPWSLYGRGLAELKNGLKSQGDADIAAATALAPTLPDKAKGYGLTP